jgi:hypothetical protein
VLSGHDDDSVRAPDWVEPRPYPDLGANGVLLTGRPNGQLTRQFASGEKRHLFVNTQLGSDVTDLEFLRDFGTHVWGLDVVGSVDDRGVRYCENLQTLSLNTDSSTVVDWSTFRHLRSLFAYGSRLGKRGFDVLSLKDLYLYSPKMPDLRPLATQPLKHLALSPAKSLRTLDGLEDLSLTSLMLAYTRPDLDLSNLASQASLETLHLEQVTVRHLEWVPMMPRLTKLVLWNTRSMPTLAPLRDHPSLETLLAAGRLRLPKSDAEVVASMPKLRVASVAGLTLPSHLAEEASDSY